MMNNLFYDNKITTENGPFLLILSKIKMMTQAYKCQWNIHSEMKS